MAKKKQGPKGKAPKRRPSARPQERAEPAIPDRRAMEALMREFLGGLQGAEPDDSPQGRAQALLDRAFQARGDREREQLAREALAICPDAVDAYNLLAEMAASPREQVALYEQAVAAAERALGPEAFAEQVGHFWLLLETRPYMRARLGLANALWALGRREEAVAHFRDMIRLNPGDNQGVRYTLLICLLSLGRDDEAEALLDQYEEEGSAFWAYTRALLAFRRGGPGEPADRLLAAAKRVNKHVPAYLLGDKPMPRESPAYVGLGDDNEAVAYAEAMLGRWRDTPGAIAWLRGTVKKPKRKKPKGPPVQGPLPIVKERLRRLTPAPGEVWQADTRPMPTWVEVSGAMVRPQIGLVVSPARGLILGQAIFDEPPGPDALWDLLARAMEAPLMGDPHRPARVEVRPDAGWDVLAANLEEIGVRLATAGRLDLMDHLVADLFRHLAEGEGPTFPGLLEDGNVTPAEAARFYEAAADYYRRAPWRLVGGEPIVEVAVAGDPLGRRYGVVMGQMGMTFGLALYDDLKWLRRLRREEFTDEEGARKSVALSLTYGDQTEIPIPDLEAIERHEWEVAGPEAYPHAMRKERGMVMRPPDSRELNVLTAALRALPDFLARRPPEDPSPEEVEVQGTSGPVHVRLTWVPDE